MPSKICKTCGRSSMSHLMANKESIMLMASKFGTLQVDACSDCYWAHGEEKISRKAVKKIINLPPYLGFYLKE